MEEEELLEVIGDIYAALKSEDIREGYKLFGPAMLKLLLWLKPPLVDFEYLPPGSFEEGDGD